MKQLPERTKNNNWVQTERAAHEAFALLIRRSPLAAQIMHILTARVGDHNAVVISQKNLAALTHSSERGVRKALNILSSDNWIEIRQIGERATINAYVLNDRIVWAQSRDKLKYSLFSANVIVSSDEQPDQDILEDQRPLRRLPKIGEMQIPFGDGLPPPSQPSLPDMEPDLPAAGTQLDIDDILKNPT